MGRTELNSSLDALRIMDQSASHIIVRTAKKFKTSRGAETVLFGILVHQLNPLGKTSDSTGGAFQLQTRLSITDCMNSSSSTKLNARISKIKSRDAASLSTLNILFMIARMHVQ